jgi:UDP-glucuronate decarboxylase
MIILVTGGAGFIGTNLCLKLLEQGHEIICVDNLMINKYPKINHKNFKFIKHDVIDFSHVELTHRYNIHKLDQIYHLACPASPPIYQRDPLHTINTCIKGTMNICDIARRFNCPILFTSTSEIYGEPTISPQTESYRGSVNTVGPRSCYDEGKRLAETILFEFHSMYKVDIKVCRIFNTYGPYLNSKDGRVVSNFVNQILKGQKVTIYGDGSQTRSFCYVDDLVSGLEKLMNSDITGPVNLGNPTEITILELANTIGSLLNVNVQFEYKELPKDDPTHRCPDISYAKQVLNWEPSVDLKEGLIKTIEYYSSII